MNDAIDQFRDALADAGIHLAAGVQIVPDGQLHRARAADDKPGQRTAWYRLHLDSPIAGAAGDWRKGISTRWCSKRESALTAKERGELAARILLERAEAKAEQECRHRDAARRAAWIWSHAKPASPDHPYLTRKQIAPGVARQSGDAIVLPVMDFTGRLYGLQFIEPDGQKRFLTGMGKTTHFIPATDELPDGSRPLWIAEGWATASYLQSQRQAVDVVAGLDAGNLLSVATEARKRWPRLDIVICPDFDAIGRQKGQEAAEKACAKILPPPASVPPGCTDWLDLANHRRGVAHGA
jgi:putative DNA primase/helicase